MKPLGFFILTSLFFSCSVISLFLPANASEDKALEGLVFINEVYTFESEEKDWVELFNNSTSSVDLSGFGLSDDADDPFRWSFPEHSLIDAKSFLVIDFDGKKDNPGFNLNSKGEILTITTPDTKYIIDAITVPSITENESYGRTTDGAATWKTFTTPTKGGPNS